MPDSPTPRVYVLDAYGLMYQMFHGIAPMNAPDGRPTQAVFGVTRALMNLYDIGAEYLLAAYDTEALTFRSSIDAEYKAHRPETPDDLKIQKPMIRQVFENMRIPILEMDGYEADDIMATIATRGAELGYEVHLCTSDKDCRQLLSDRVKIDNLRKGEVLDAAKLMADWGVTPSQVADYQALVGDSVDNVPGVPGCGAKTAAKWLQQYGTLDNIIAHADELGGPKLKQAFKDAVANGKLDESRKLVKLVTDMPLAMEWENWKRRDWDGMKLLELFQDLGFRGFANRVRSTLTKSGAFKNNAMLETMGIAPVNTAPRPSAKAAPKGSLFDAIYETETTPAETPVDDWKYDGYMLVNDQKSFTALMALLKNQKRFCFDLETTSLDPHLAEIVGIAFCWTAGEAYYLALQGPKGECVLDKVATLAALKPIFEDAAVQKVNQNIKYDLLVLRAHGIELNGLAGDSMVAHYLLNAAARTHNLDDLSWQYLNHPTITIDTLIGKGKKQISMAAVPLAKIRDYAAEDADVAWRLTEKFESALGPLKTLYDDVEMPLMRVLADLEYEGVRIDTAFLGKLSIEMDGQLAALEKHIHGLAGKEFNVASPIQLRKILFDEMRLPIQKRTGTTGDASTDQETLENLAAMGHELPKAIIDHRQIAKLKGTYVDALPALVNPKTGRLHTSFNQTVAATGRLSSSDPNLQNIPARTDQGQQIRAAFIPRDGWVLLSADYSQIELRLLAHFSGDDALKQAFLDDRDVHTLVAADIFKVPESEVTSAQRRVAKTVNFGVIYGMSAFGLGTRLGMPRKEAATFIDAYFDRYPKVLEYQDTLLRNARTNGFVATILGRRRPFDPIAIRARTTYQQRNQAEREAINMEIQGSAADLMKLAMLKVQARLKTEKRQAKMLLSIHDELVFDVPPEELADVAKLVRKEMTTAMTLGVPLRVDASAGPNWLDGKDVF